MFRMIVLFASKHTDIKCEILFSLINAITRRDLKGFSEELRYIFNIYGNSISSEKLILLQHRLLSMVRIEMIKFVWLHEMGCLVGKERIINMQHHRSPISSILPVKKNSEHVLVPEYRICYCRRFLRMFGRRFGLCVA